MSVREGRSLSLKTYYVYRFWTRDGLEGVYYAYATLPVQGRDSTPTPIGRSFAKHLDSSPVVMDEDQLTELKKKLTAI